MLLLATFLSIFALCLHVGQAKPQILSNGVLRPILMKGGEQFVAGGVDVPPGSVPWQLSVQRQSTTWRHNFGASLLCANGALTAAHSLDGSPVSNLRVVAGLHQQSDLTGTQIVLLSSYTMHELYGVGAWTYPNDIAILTFATPVIIGGNVQPATLPVDNSNDYAGYTCVITGWGGTDSDTLQMAELQVLSTEECSSSATQICVYDPAQIAGVCGGDNGGPLNCPDGVTRVVGVGSYIIADGGDNCQQTLPAVFTRVSSYLDWIAANAP